MDLTTQGALQWECVDSASSTICTIENFGMLYLPFAYFLFFVVFLMIVGFFIIRIPKTKNYD